MFQVGTQHGRNWLSLVALAVLVACGGKLDDASSSVDPATPTVPTPVAGSRSLPNVRSAGGQTISSPHVVPVFFGTGDTREAELTTFLGALPGSEYWKSTTSEYGVGDVGLAATIHATGELPPTMTNLDLRDWFITRFSGSFVEFPPVDTAGAIYVLFLQPHTIVNAPWGKSCVDYRAYHGEAVVQGKRAVFAVIPRCAESKESEIDALTRSITHELVEAATDPFVDSHPAYGLPDDRGLGWVLGAGSEVTDMCAFEPSAYGELGGHSAARSWSNLAASAGHDPCVPAVPGPYYNAEPIFPQTMTFKLGAGKTRAQSIKVAVGDSQTIDVMPFADGAIDSWTLVAQDEPTLFGSDPELELSFDAATAHPGETRHLTIKRLADSASGATAFVIVSRTANGGHHWWGVVSN